MDKFPKGILVNEANVLDLYKKLEAKEEIPEETEQKVVKRFYELLGD